MQPTRRSRAPGSLQFIGTHGASLLYIPFDKFEHSLETDSRIPLHGRTKVSKQIHASIVLPDKDFRQGSGPVLGRLFHQLRLAEEEVSHVGLHCGVAGRNWLPTVQAQQHFSVAQPFRGSFAASSGLPYGLTFRSAAWPQTL